MDDKVILFVFVWGLICMIGGYVTGYDSAKMNYLEKRIKELTK